MAEKDGVDTPKLNLTRKKVETDEKDESQEVVPVSSPIDKVIDLAFNPSRDKIREVTIIDRIQGRLFPLLDMINTGREFILEVALYRQDAKAYKVKFGKEKPISPNLLEELIHRTAQWQKSVAGKNLERATDIALAETEVRGGEDDDPFSKIRDPYDDK